MKFAEQIKAVLDGATIERRYTGPKLIASRNVWQVPVISPKTLVSEMALEYQGWEYRVKVEDKVVYRCMSSHPRLWKDYTTKQNFVGEDQFKITYEGNSDKIKSIEVME